MLPSLGGKYDKNSSVSSRQVQVNKTLKWGVRERNIKGCLRKYALVICTGYTSWREYLTYTTAANIMARGNIMVGGNHASARGVGVGGGGGKVTHELQGRKAA